ncbi:hypothetical protein M5K25_004576 [Dendrobium thyrsiflorum]|uniref:Peroxisomal membrane protein PEX14 n=1 Tax=Dendrobium thyrsiflorum TaxID=117978 RepID=A0ABD0VM11_DENTH
MSLLLDPSPTILNVWGGSPGSHTGCHAQVYFPFSFFFFISVRLWPPDLFSLLPGPLGGGSLNQSSEPGRLWLIRIQAPFSSEGLRLQARMEGEWMMDPIKIPWFRRPGPSWSLVYLVRGGSRPNLTEGSLSAAMGCFVQGYLVDLGDAIWRRITWFRGPRVITVYPAVPFGNKTAALQSLASASVEPTAAPHPKSYMEIMAMVERGEKPPNIREINDMPPNPNQPPSKPLVAPRTKRETAMISSRENGQIQDVSSDPWWRNKSVEITELEPGDEEPLRKFPYSIGASEKPSSQRVWIPPQPPSVALPEAAAAIRHPKSLLPIQKQHSDNNDKIEEERADGIEDLHIEMLIDLKLLEEDIENFKLLI